MPPKNVILQKPPPAKSDSTLTLACTAEDSNPKTQLLWYRGGNLIHNAGNFGERHGMTTLGSCDQYFMPRISSLFRRELFFVPQFLLFSFFEEKVKLLLARELGDTYVLEQLGGTK